MLPLRRCNESGKAGVRAGAAGYRFRSRPCHANPRVTIIVRGGVAEALPPPPGVEVDIIDYDVDGTDDATLDRDADGYACGIQHYPVLPPA